MLELEQTEALNASPSIEAISDIPEVDKKTKILRKAIDVIFFNKDPGATESEKNARYIEFMLSKMGLVIFTDKVSAGTKKTPNIITRVQDAFETLMLTERESK